MPSFPIVDTHLHLWDLTRLRYPWLSGVPKLNKNHLMEDYRRACGPAAVAKMVESMMEAAMLVPFQWARSTMRRAPSITGLSIIRPSSWTAAPARMSAAASTRSAQWSSSELGASSA